MANGGIWKYDFGSLVTIRTNGFGVSGNTLWLEFDKKCFSRESRELKKCHLYREHNKEIISST